MKILIVGHSDSVGTGLRDPGQAWPRLLGANLQGSGAADVEVVHRQLNPLRKSFEAYVAAEVSAVNPDVCLVLLTSAVFSLPQVRISVRRRYGARAERLYLRFERRATGPTAFQGPIKQRAKGGGQWLARRLLGQATHIPVETAIGLYSDLLNLLARQEGIRVVVMTCSLRSPSFNLREPWADRQIRFYIEALHGVAKGHRMEWVDLEDLLARSGDRAACFGPDEVHKSEFGHQHIARELAQVLVPKASKTG